MFRGSAWGGSCHSQRGVTSIEYALFGALIAAVIVGTVTSLGISVSDFFNFVSGEVAKAAAAAGN
ncbi:Flp family type IVb pilin [Zeimonas arvi]|uniref:Flp family type IVb pilin n=2 Tax=Zeimonas arvi TaxID=2498847 RepID=A0A5C8NYT5_9BURK|nr:Flp family type IVb pilin [Zeimonas arvi]